MNKTAKAALVAVTAAGLALAASPAYATSWDGSTIDYVDGSGGWWEVSNGNGSTLTFLGAFSNDYGNNGADNNTFDDGLIVSDRAETWDYTCATADWVVATDGTEDIILTCATETGIDLNGSAPVDVQVELRFHDDGENKATVRQTVLVQNNNGAAVTGAVLKILTNWYQDNYTNLVYSPTLGSKISNWPTGNSDPADVLTDADHIFVTDCPTGTNQCDPSYDPAVVYQAYSSDAAVKSTLSDTYADLGGDAAGDLADDTAGFLYALPSIPAGDGVMIVTMVRSFMFPDGADDDATGALSLAQSNDAVSFAQNGGWNGDCAGQAQLTAGIADFSKVVNWTTTCTSPALPDTGVSEVMMVSVTVSAALLAGAGVALLVVRRRHNI